MSAEQRHFKHFKKLHKQSMLTKVERARDTQTNGNGASGPAEVLHEALQIPRPDEPFPYLEKLVVATKKYPYAAIGVMISIAAIVISAVTILAVSVGGGMFLMYGEMKANTALMQEILTKQKSIEQRVDDDGKVLRAYAAVNGKRVEFVIGLLSKEAQEKVNQYDRAHPDPLFPDRTERKEQ